MKRISFEDQSLKVESRAPYYIDFNGQQELMGSQAYPGSPRAEVKAGVWNTAQASGVAGPVPLAGQGKASVVESVGGLECRFSCISSLPTPPSTQRGPSGTFWKTGCCSLAGGRRQEEQVSWSRRSRQGP